MKTLYMIGGPMGVGKTAVCRKLQQQLPRNVFLDGDWCWDANPFQVTEETKTMAEDNICYLLNSFLRCSAYENVLFCWVMHDQTVIDSLLTRLDLGACCVKCISLTASAEALRERLGRDVQAGIRTADVVPRSLAKLPLFAALQTVQIDTTGKSVQEVAVEILEG